MSVIGQPLSGAFLPFDVDLGVTYPDLRYLGMARRLHMASTPNGNWALIVDERGRKTELPPDRQVRVLTFATPIDLATFVHRTWLTTPNPFPGRPDAPDDRPGGARLPVVPTAPPPTRPGGAALTLDEAVVPPRSL